MNINMNQFTKLIEARDNLAAELINPILKKVLSIIERETGKSLIDMMMFGTGVMEIKSGEFNHVPFNDYFNCDALMHYRNPLWC